MDEKLKLSPDQKSKLKQIYLDSYAQEDRYKKEANGDREKFMQLSMNTRKTRDDSVKTILTPPQQQEWEKVRREEKAEHPQKRQ